MLAYRIQNIRSIVDSGDIQLKPLSIFIGANSSGKSTALRIFPLLKQSAERDLSSPFLLNGNIVDFGDPDEIISRFNENNDEFVLSFCFHEKDIPLSINTSFYVFHDDERSFLSKLEISHGNNYYEYIFNADGTFIIKVNTKKISLPDFLTKATQSSFLPNLHGVSIGNKKSVHALDYLIPLAFENKKISGSIEGLSSLILRFGSDIIVTPDHIKETLQEYSPKVKVNLAQLERFALSASAIQLYFVVEKYLKAFSKKILYFDPLRARGQRYYRKEELSFDSVDSRGDNIYVIIKRMQKNNLLERFNLWAGRHFGFEIGVKDFKGHTSLYIQDSFVGAVNLIDCGFGYSQIIPIVVMLWDKIVNKSDFAGEAEISMIAIEQPELHLHPVMQGRIADVIASCVEICTKNKISIPIIIETHSPIIMTKIGENIEELKIKKEDVAVYLFSRKDSGETQIKTSSFDKNGDVLEWPYGFMSAEF